MSLPQRHGNREDARSVEPPMRRLWRMKRDGEMKKRGVSRRESASETTMFLRASARRADVDDINQPYSAPAARTERRDAVPYNGSHKTQSVYDVITSAALREGAEKDENGDYFGRRQYRDTARPKERREKTITNIPYT